MRNLKKRKIFIKTLFFLFLTMKLFKTNSSPTFSREKRLQQMKKRIFESQIKKRFSVNYLSFVLNDFESEQFRRIQCKNTFFSFYPSSFLFFLFSKCVFLETTKEKIHHHHKINRFSPFSFLQKKSKKRK